MTELELKLENQRWHLPIITMRQIESNSPRELSYKLRESRGVTVPGYEPKLELRLEYQGQHIPITPLGLEILSELESERAYEELIRDGPPYQSGNLDRLRTFSTNMCGRQQAERELITPGLIEIDPDGDNREKIYRLSDIAREGRYVAIVRDEMVNS